GQAEAAHRGDGHDRDLVGQAVHHGTGYGVALVRSAQQDGRQAGQVVVGDLALMDPDRDLLDPLHAEVPGQVADQSRIRAPAVLRAYRVPELLEARAVAPAPVARDGAEGQVPGHPAVRRDADGVDARAADHGHAPVRTRSLQPFDRVRQARTQDSEGVVD